MTRTLVAAALCVSAVAGAFAQDSRTWNAYVEVVSVDRAAKAMTVKAMTEPNIANYVKGFNAGDKVAIVWSIEGARGGDAQTVAVILTPEEMKTIDVGYIMRAEFVAGDAAARMVTFKMVVPDAVLSVAAAAKPGNWLKIAAPMEQPGTGTTLTAVMVTDKPAPRPARPKPQPVVAAAAVAASTVKANGGISGAWRVVLNIGLPVECDLAQDGQKLGGTCSAQGGASTPVTGTVDGANVSFSCMPNLGGNVIDLQFKGVVEAGGAKMTGSASLAGMEDTFSATKK